MVAITKARTIAKADKEYRARLKRAKAEFKREDRARTAAAKAAANKARRYQAQQKRDAAFRAKLEVRRRKEEAAKERKARTLHAKGRRGDYIAKRNPMFMFAGRKCATNPSGDVGDRRTLARARALSQKFNGTPDAVYELTPAERKPLPRFVAAVGQIATMTYETEPGSKRTSKAYIHESGDRGFLRPKSSERPLLVADENGKPQLLRRRSPMKLTSAGLIG